MKSLSVALMMSLFGLAFPAFGKVELRVGKIYALDQPDQLIYTEKTELTRLTDTDFSTKATIEDATGVIVMRETSRIENSVVVEQFMEQLQINEAYELKRKDNKLVFSTYKLKGDQRTLESSSEQSLPDQFVTGPAIGMFLKKNRKQLEAGETVKAEFGIFEMEKSINFSFRKISVNDGKLQIQMKISNVLLRMLVDPIDIDVDVNSFDIVRFKGRTPLRTGPEGNLKPLDAIINYSHSVQEGK